MVQMRCGLFQLISCQPNAYLAIVLMLGGSVAGLHEAHVTIPSPDRSRRVGVK